MKLGERMEELLIKAERIGYNKSAFQGSFYNFLCGSTMSKSELISLCNRRFNSGKDMPWHLRYVSTPPNPRQEQG